MPDRAYKMDECPHCGGHDDWGRIEWEDPYGDEIVAWARCPECGGLHKLVFALKENVPVQG